MAFLKSFLKGSSKHKKLSEEMALQNSKEGEKSEMIIENDNDVVTFKLKYLGSTVVEKLSGENVNTEAVKNVLKTAKASRKKMQRVNVAISLKGITVTDLQGNDVFKTSIYRISNCSTDPTHRQIFSFISTDQKETMECHAFFCSKRKMAETVTLAVAHAFATAFEAWKERPESKDFVNMAEKNLKNLKTVEDKENAGVIPNDTRQTSREPVVEEKLIDFDSELSNDDLFKFEPAVSYRPNYSNSWVCFEDDFVSEKTKLPHNVDLVFA